MITTNEREVTAMGAYKTMTLTNEECASIITRCKNGFEWDNIQYKSNNRIATILTLMANTGLRIGDILQLKLSSVIKDGDRYRFNIVEQKTGKERNFTVHDSIYNYMLNYAVDNKISRDARLFSLSERAVQKHLKAVCSSLGLINVSTHSFRKYFATTIYNNNNYNIAIVKELLQHSSIATTQRYIGIRQKDVETALNNHVNLF